MAQPELVKDITANRTTSLGKLESELKDDLDWVIDRATRRAPEDRYPSASAMAHDLERYLKNLPVAARQTETGYLMRKYMKRHRQGLLALGGVFSALVIGTGVSIWQANIATQQEAIALEAKDNLQASLSQLDLEKNRLANLAKQASETELEAARKFEVFGKYTEALTALGRALHYDSGNKPAIREALRIIGNQRHQLPILPNYELISPPGKSIASIQFHPTLPLAAVVFFQGGVALYRLEERSAIEVRYVETHHDGWGEVCFSNDGLWFFILDNRFKDVRLLTLAVSVASDGKPQVLSLDDHTVPVWLVETNPHKRVGTLLRELRFSSARRWLGARDESKVWLWRLKQSDLTDPKRSLAQQTLQTKLQTYSCDKDLEILDFQILEDIDGILICGKVKSGPLLADGSGFVSLVQSKSDDQWENGIVCVVKDTVCRLTIDTNDRSRFAILTSKGSVYLGSTKQPYNLKLVSKRDWSEWPDAEGSISFDPSGMWLQVIGMKYLRSHVVRLSDPLTENCIYWLADGVSGGDSFLLNDEGRRQTFHAMVGSSFIYEIDNNEIWRWSSPFVRDTAVNLRARSLWGILDGDDKGQFDRHFIHAGVEGLDYVLSLNLGNERAKVYCLLDENRRTSCYEPSRALEELASSVSREDVQWIRDVVIPGLTGRSSDILRTDRLSPRDQTYLRNQILNPPKEVSLEVGQRLSALIR